MVFTFIGIYLFAFSRAVKIALEKKNLEEGVAIPNSHSK